MMKFLAGLLLTASATTLHAQQPGTTPEVTIGPNSAILSLTAEGESRRVPDLAMFSAGVVTQAPTASEALRENSAKMDSVIAALKRAGIADRDIQTSTISLSPQYSDPVREAALRAREAGQPFYPPSDQARRIIGYQARNTVQVRVRDLTKMGRVIDTLVSVGANEVNGPNFTLDEEQAALDEARAEAVAKGRERAQLYARAAGMRVARILSISEGGGYHPVRNIIVTGARAGPPPPMPERDAPVAPGELSLGVNVSMQFELVR